MAWCLAWCGVGGEYTVERETLVFATFSICLVFIFNIAIIINIDKQTSSSVCSKFGYTRCDIQFAESIHDTGLTRDIHESSIAQP